MFIAIFAEGDIAEGDVIVFDARELEGGGLTTRRVVEVTDEGYITRGDNNPFTDQEGDEPPVTDDRVVATALQVDGDVVTIPGLGTAILGFQDAVLGLQATILSLVGFEGSDDIQGTGIVLLLAGTVLLLVTALDSLRASNQRDRSRSRRDSHEFDPRPALVFLLLVVLVPANAAMLGSAGTHEVPVEATDGDQPAGGELTATNGGLVTMLVVLDTPAEDATLSDTRIAVPGGDSRGSTVTAPEPPPGEERTVTVTERRYLLVLPESLLADLHAVTPWLAVGAINGALGFGVLAFAGGLLGLRRRRLRDTSRDIGLRLRLRRLLRFR